MKKRLTESLLRAKLDRLGLNARRDDPVEEAERIDAKQEYCLAYGQKHPACLEEALICTVSAGRSASPYTLTGAKIRTGGKRGHEAAHGTESEKRKRWSNYQAEVDRLHAVNPNLPYENICAKVAKSFNVSSKTISRHTYNPRRKK